MRRAVRVYGLLDGRREKLARLRHLCKAPDKHRVRCAIMRLLIRHKTILFRDFLPLSFRENIAKNENNNHNLYIKLRKQSPRMIAPFQIHLMLMN